MSVVGGASASANQTGPTRQHVNGMRRLRTAQTHLRWVTFLAGCPCIGRVATLAAACNAPAGQQTCGNVTLRSRGTKAANKGTVRFAKCKVLARLAARPVDVLEQADDGCDADPAPNEHQYPVPPVIELVVAVWAVAPHPHLTELHVHKAGTRQEQGRNKAGTRQEHGTTVGAANQPPARAAAFCLL